MSTTTLRIAGAGLFLLFIFLSGFWLSSSGRPLNTILLTVHKLLGVAAVIVLAVIVYRTHQDAGLSTLELAVVAITAVCFVATIITGGLLSTSKEIPGIVLTLHQALPFATVLSTAVTLVLIKE